MPQAIAHGIQATNLADILERVLDKGVVIAGDIKVSIADIELLSIKIRLLVASVEKVNSLYYPAVRGQSGGVRHGRIDRH